MCQIDEGYNRLECNQKIHLLALNRKYEETASLIIRAIDSFCRSCFKEYLIHKFRAMPGKNRVIFPQEKVLLAGSGGANSCLMLSQVQEVFSLPSSVLAPGSSDPDRSNPSYEVAVDQYIKQNLTEEAAAGAVSQLSIHDSQHKQAGIRDTVRLADDAHS